MIKLLSNTLLFIAFVLVSTRLVSQDLPEPMNPPRLVNDYVGALSNQEFQALENKLERYADTTSNQVAIAIINSTGDYDISQYGAELGEKWGVGGSQDNNGVLILVAVTDRTVNISTGYGLEGAIPDIAARRIIQDYVVPNFREGDYYSGLDQATTVIIKLAEGEYRAEDVARGRQTNRRTSKGIGMFLPLLIFAVFSFFRYRGAARRQLGHNAGFWAITALMMSSGGRRGSGFNDFSGGGGSFGGGGGGFGGFGGGGFGGGGASGSW